MSRTRFIAMNQDQVNICRQILESLLHRPIAKLFWIPSPSDLSSGRRHPISFKYVIERLDHGLYLSADEWMSDVRILLTVPQKRTQSSFRASAALQLAQEFDILTQTLSPALSPHILQLQVAESRLGSFVESISPSILESSSDQKVPAAEVFKVERSDDMGSIADDIRNFFTPTLVLQVAAFVSVIEPTALVLDEKSARILVASMSPTTREKLRAFVSELMENAAKGTIDAFSDKQVAVLTELI
jgi:hypothetical protein